VKKEDLITAIAKLAGVSDPGPGAGSSVYKSLLVDVCIKFGMDANGTMPQLAQRIVTKANLPYSAQYFDSRLTPSGGGSTVTFKELQAILAAVKKLKA
jgi:hypothetical protein